MRSRRRRFASLAHLLNVYPRPVMHVPMAFLNPSTCSFAAAVAELAALAPACLSAFFFADRPPTPPAAAPTAAPLPASPAAAPMSAPAATPFAAPFTAVPFVASAVCASAALATESLFTAAAVAGSKPVCSFDQA